ncbi:MULTISPECIES: hypothetical protein [Mesorhizobium]|uniref:hypothetical protein n=1 Tax=Mesorhizobium TaxID=68287 RepID=UPI00112DC1BA|nr:MULTISPECIES: hypothetical protein [Mesorhizobium]MBZ9697198.1 hypothetical protein [Mesorhizobium sp. CO1-1-9]MBZ9976539.1 hypothetical protein [Mesorhizobium sp. BR-1-1-10]TPJ19996.1 hypothetical protein FJW04_01220 [Mesorhizobium sp. B2-7-3]TPK13368.1 hypothetical protein FJ543_16365 [Mesorhizobium sp. B2-5-7]TPK70256.1 hypothetical protein FJ527_28855 [Mesorhizobium sp. B2-4-18]
MLVSFELKEEDKSLAPEECKGTESLFLRIPAGQPARLLRDRDVNCASGKKLDDGFNVLQMFNGDRAGGRSGASARRKRKQRKAFTLYQP